MSLRRKPRWFSENLVNSVQLLVDLIPRNRVVFGEALDAHLDVVGDLERIALVITEFVSRTLGTSSMRALGIRSSYKGRTVDAQAMRGDEGRGQLRKASASR